MTRLFGIIGDPVAQARSPELFNDRFREQGIDAVMVPMQVTGEGFGAVLAGLRAIGNLDGLVVTVPHKPAAAGMLRSGSERVRIAGAANVLRPVANGWAGDLFDGEGFTAGLEARGIPVAGRRCSIVGAGGAGAAIALALLEREVAGLTIWDVDGAKAARLAERLTPLRLAAVAVAEPAPESDLVVNATPLGMRPDDPLPMSLDGLQPHAVVADVIMKPPVTRLLAEAGRRGFRTHEGRHMLDCQMQAIWSFFGLPAKTL